MTFLRPGRDLGLVGPTLLSAALIGQKETEGISPVVATLDVSTAGLNLICFDAVRTAIRTTPVLNNSNTYAAIATEQDYSPDFPQYDIEMRVCLSAAGGSAHSSSMTKSTATTEETTHVLLGVAGGTQVDATSVNRPSQAGVGTHTSASFNVGGSATALAIAIASGTGFSTGSVVQDLTMASNGWSDVTGLVNGVAGQIFKFVHSGATAPSGHIPFRAWWRWLSPGTGYAWQVTPTFQPSAGQAEGVVMMTAVVR